MILTVLKHFAYELKEQLQELNLPRQNNYE